MVCLKCGKELPEDANFCLQCGAPLHTDNGEVGTDVRYEICEIRACFVRYEVSWNYRFYSQFVADAIGPNGRYTAQRSKLVDSDFKGDQTPGAEVVLIQSEQRRDAKVRQTFDAFVTAIILQGWEPLGQFGEHWYNVRFRRRLF